MKWLFCLTLMALVALPVFADPPDENVLRPAPSAGGDSYAELGIGFNLTFLQGIVRNQNGFEQPTSIFKSATGLGFLGEVAVGHFFTPNFGLGLRADYDVRAADNTAQTIDTCRVVGNPGSLSGLLPTSKRYSVRADYLALSLLGHFRVDNWILSIGPSIGIPLSGRIEEQSQILDDSSNCFYFSDTPDRTKNVLGTNTQRDSIATRFSVKLSAAYVVRLNERISLVPQVGFDVALGDTYKDHPTLRGAGGVSGEDLVYFPRYNKGIRLHAMQATLGLRFNL